MDFSNNGRGSGKVGFGVVIILIGLAIFLKQIDMLPYLNLRFTWPIILIAIGLFIGIRNKFSNNAPFILMAIGVFNLIPAFSFNIGTREVDSEDLVIPAILIIAGLVMIVDVRATFGGIEILVPSDWDIKNEIQPIFGSVEDQRTIRIIPNVFNRKTLVLQGSCFCGGIEIKSY